MTRRTLAFLLTPVECLPEFLKNHPIYQRRDNDWRCFEIYDPGARCVWRIVGSGAKSFPHTQQIPKDLGSSPARTRGVNPRVERVARQCKCVYDRSAAPRWRNRRRYRRVLVRTTRGLGLGCQTRSFNSVKTGPQNYQSPGGAFLESIKEPRQDGQSWGCDLSVKPFVFPRADGRSGIGRMILASEPGRSRQRSWSIRFKLKGAAFTMRRPTGQKAISTAIACHCLIPGTSSCSTIGVSSSNWSGLNAVFPEGRDSIDHAPGRPRRYRECLLRRAALGRRQTRDHCASRRVAPLRNAVMRLGAAPL